jgi:hypothetical protein
MRVADAIIVSSSLLKIGQQLNHHSREEKRTKITCPIRLEDMNKVFGVI